MAEVLEAQCIMGTYIAILCGREKWTVTPAKKLCKLCSDTDLQYLSCNEINETQN